MIRLRGWDCATVAAVAAWIALVAVLMIADVWDETNGMLAFSSPAESLGAKLGAALTEPTGFWRPIPTLLYATILHFVVDFDVSWRLLRALNAIALLAALWVMLQALELDGGRRFLLTAAVVFSGSGIITAGWYVNVFDAWVLLLVAIGLRLLLADREIAAGLVFGAAFFCKEVAALVLPFLLVLVAAERITAKQALRAGVPVAVLGACYFSLRSLIVPFGGGTDIHGFGLAHLAPTLVNLGESFWEQNLKAPSAVGFLWLALSLAALRRPRLIGATVVFLLATAVVYWGMLGEHQNGVLIDHLDFVGRLYLVPVTLVLLLLAIERRTVTMALLLLPIVAGGYVTWRDHARFQQTYRRIYTIAERTTVKPLTVRYPPKPLDDDVRGIVIGDLPDAALVIDARTGELHPE